MPGTLSRDVTPLLPSAVNLNKTSALSEARKCKSENYERLTDRPTNRPTDGHEGP